MSQQPPFPLIIAAAMAIVIPNAIASEQTSLVYISDKLSPPAAAGNTDVRAASITPTGAHALYVLAASNNVSDGTLFSVPLSGGAPVPLLEGVDGRSYRPEATFQATADGQHVIAFRGDAPGIGSVFSIPISGGTPTLLGTTKNTRTFMSTTGTEFDRVDFVLSPDGSRCAFINPVDGIVSAPVAGGSPISVSQSIVVFEGINFSPDSQTIYFVGAHSGSSRAFYSAPADGSSPPSVLYLVDNGSAPIQAGLDARLLPDGSAIISNTGGNRYVRSIQKFVLGSAAPTTIAVFPRQNGDSTSDVFYDVGTSHLFVAEQGADPDPEEPPEKELHFVDLLAGTQTSLGTLPGINYPPILSPDGSHAVYTGDEKLWSQPLAGGDAVCLSESPIPDFVALDPIGFNSDGSRVAFHGREPEADTFELYSNTVDGSSLLRLSPTLPSGRRIRGGLEQISIDRSHVFYFADFGDVPLDDYVFRVPIAGGDSELMHQVGAPGGDVDVLVQNPDGSGIAMIADLADNAVDELFYRNFEDSADSTLSERGEGDSRLTSFAITADSRFAVYRAQQFTPGIDELAAAPTTGGPIRRLNRDPVLKGDVRSFTFELSPDSQHAVFLGDMDTNTVTELYSVPVEGGEQKKLHPDLTEASGAEVEQFQISPDSQHVVFSADIELDRKFEIYLSAIDESSFRRISPDFTFGDAGPFLFSPDGKLIAFGSPDASTNGSINLYVHDIEANTTTRHPTLLFPAGLMFSPDSKHIAVLSGSLNRDLTLTNIEGDITFVLDRTSYASIAFTGDSKTLFHLNSDRTNVLATDTSTGITSTFYSGSDRIQQFVVPQRINHAVIQTADIGRGQVITVPDDGSPPITVYENSNSDPVFGQIVTDPDSHDILFSADQALWMHSVSVPTSAEIVSDGYEVTGTYQLIPGGDTGFFIGRPEGSDQIPGLNFIDPNEDDGPTVIPVRPIPQQGAGPMNNFVVSRDGRQVFYMADLEKENFFNLYAATTGTCLTTRTFTTDDALESAGSTDATALESLLAGGNFTGLRFGLDRAEKDVGVYSAKLTLTASADQTDVDREVLIEIQDDTDPPTFVTGNSPDISTRTTTPDVTATWPLGDWMNGESYISPDLSQHFQQLLAKPDWQDGNYAALILSTPDDSEPLQPHQFSHFEADPSTAPELELILRSDRSLGPLERLGFGDWASQQQLEGSAPDDDPDGDGLTLGVEYALGLDPNNADPSPAPDLQFFPWTEGNLHPYVTFVRDQRRTSAIVSLEASTDLQAWHTVTTSTLGARNTIASEVTTQDGLVEVSISLPHFGADEQAARYVRFRVTIP